MFVKGEVTYRSYVDKDQVTRYVTEIRAMQIGLLGSKNGAAPAAGAPAPAQNRARPAAAAPAASFPSDDGGAMGAGVEESELPF